MTMPSQRTFLVIYVASVLFLLVGYLTEEHLLHHLPTQVVAMWVGLGISWLPFWPFATAGGWTGQTLITTVWLAALLWPLPALACKPSLLRRWWFIGLVVVHAVVVIVLGVGGVELYRAVFSAGGV